MSQKHKIGSTAIPFLLTALISLIVVGGAAVYILDKISGTEASENSQEVIENEYYKPTSEDNQTVLLILDLEDGHTIDTFMVLRTLPASKKYICVPLASNTLGEMDGEKLPISRIYADGGIVKLKDAVEKLLDTPVDRYMKMNGDAFQKICNILGGASFDVPEGVKDFTSGVQFLSATQIQSLVTYTDYKNGEQQRMIIAGSLAVSMLNQTNGDRVAEQLDETFNDVINIVDSDISVVDYADRKKALKYLIIEAIEPAQIRNPYGAENEEGYFVMDSAFADDIKGWFEINS